MSMTAVDLWKHNIPIEVFSLFPQESQVINELFIKAIQAAAEDLQKTHGVKLTEMESICSGGFGNIKLAFECGAHQTLVKEGLVTFFYNTFLKKLLRLLAEHAPDVVLRWGDKEFSCEDLGKYDVYLY